MKSTQMLYAFSDLLKDDWDSFIWFASTFFQWKEDLGSEFENVKSEIAGFEAFANFINEKDNQSDLSDEERLSETLSWMSANESQMHASLEAIENNIEKFR